jgi:hypothetical protein
MIACRDCRHVRNGTRFSPRCHHPASAIESIDYFTGQPVTTALSVDHMRSAYGGCGLEARLFEPKEKDGDS